jgi:hypothetical protein
MDARRQPAGLDAGEINDRRRARITRGVDDIGILQQRGSKAGILADRGGDVAQGLLNLALALEGRQETGEQIGVTLGDRSLVTTKPV